MLGWSDARAEHLSIGTKTTRLPQSLSSILGIFENLRLLSVYSLVLLYEVAALRRLLVGHSLIVLASAGAVRLLITRIDARRLHAGRAALIVLASVVMKADTERRRVKRLLALSDRLVGEGLLLLS